MDVDGGKSDILYLVSDCEELVEFVGELGGGDVASKEGRCYFTQGRGECNATLLGAILI